MSLRHVTTLCAHTLWESFKV